MPIKLKRKNNRLKHKGKVKITQLTDTTDVTDGQNCKILKRIEIRDFENCSA